MSNAIDPTIRKRLTDLLLDRLKGDMQTPRPPALGHVKFSKNRSIAVGPAELPLYSIYFLNNGPTPKGGDKFRPVKTEQLLLIEVRTIVQGNDDAADPYTVWAHSRIMTADRCMADGEQLALGITEGETIFGKIEGAQSEVTEVKQRFAIAYTTNPRDLTKVS